jgi:outer membrane protein OmpA-like peptidoglycan-associated protein
MAIEPNNLYELFYSESNNYLLDTDSGPNISLKFFNGELIVLEGMESKENQEKLINIFQKSGIIIRDIITIRNIRYNFATNQFTKGKNEVVNPEEEFTKLATVLDRHKHLLLKISSHTDKCPLDGNYDNLALSRRRNQAARDFISTQFPDYNIDVSRIKECAYTFNYPVDTTYNSPDFCKNDFNRRTEFKLLYRGREGYTMDMICDPNMLEYVGKPQLKSRRKRKNNSDR